MAIAGVLAMKPDVLVLDEPTAGLDPKGRDEILGEISELREKTGMTIVLVSHSMEDVANYVNRIIVTVSYTHLDVYKRQGLSVSEVPGGDGVVE